mmetsp:Transcript_5018/g.13627  ORF Transcript_5018/g.13627 Transcript_5018/m.13627 type:complete len:265 (-) Transcript_5018:5896-6690(-)
MERPMEVRMTVQESSSGGASWGSCGSLISNTASGSIWGVSLRQDAYAAKMSLCTRPMRTDTSGTEGSLATYLMGGAAAAAIAFWLVLFFIFSCSSAASPSAAWRAFWAWALRVSSRACCSSSSMLSTRASSGRHAVRTHSAAVAAHTRVMRLISVRSFRAIASGDRKEEGILDSSSRSMHSAASTLAVVACALASCCSSVSPPFSPPALGLSIRASCFLCLARAKAASDSARLALHASSDFCALLRTFSSSSLALERSFCILVT